jgi:hypothetical protein
MTPPSPVTATDGVHEDRVAVFWPPVTNATYYQVSRSDSVAGTKTALSGWISQLQWDDTTAVAGKTYYYFVQASPMTNGSGAGRSGEDTGWRGVNPPAAPTGPPVPGHQTTGHGLSVALSWPECAGAVSCGVDVWTDTGPYPDPHEDEKGPRDAGPRGGPFPEGQFPA